MKIYLVGGAVRDKLLGLPVKERDWVVVGATASDMLQLGYKQVGKDFPVFLHPETKEEYALARKERKTSPGYTGFEFDTSPDVSIEDDLLRRDLTINAIAETDEGLKDPYGGREDLKNKLLRHVSPAFEEDPVRVLRVARFAARFAHLGFTVAPETLELMKEMVKKGEVDALVAERVWKELQRALEEKNPEKFFTVLNDCGALDALFPGIDILGNGLKFLTKAASSTEDAEVRLAVLFYQSSEASIKNFCQSYKIPSIYQELIWLVRNYCESYAYVENLSAEELLDLLQAVDAFRRGNRFLKYLKSCEVIFGAKQSQFLQDLLEKVKALKMQNADFEKLSGEEKGIFIKKSRLEAIKSCRPREGGDPFS